MGKLDKARKLVDEAREEYQERKHGRPSRWEKESHDHFERRVIKWQHRVDNAEDILKHLKKKAEHLAEKKAERKEEKQANKNPYEKAGTDIVGFDGKDTVELAAYWMWEARKAGWNGYLVSGYRTPEYSQQLCYNMCGAPSCPGKCAGMASNHAKKTYPGPAIDVSEYTQFESLMFKLGSPLKNDLPIDPVHFSLSGR